MAEEYLSRREFASRVDRSFSYIQKLVKQGKIPATKKGIPWIEGEIAFRAAGVVGYDGNHAFNETQRASRPSRKPAEDTKAKPRKPPQEAPPTEYPPLTEMGLPPNATEAEVSRYFNRARAEEKMNQARIKELDFLARREELIEKSIVIDDAVDTVAEVRSLLLSIPASIAPSCEGKAAREIEGLIEDAIMRAMKALQNSVYSREGDSRDAGPGGSN